MDPIVVAKGSNGAIKVYEDYVVLSRATAMGFAAQGFAGNRTIYYQDLTSVEYRRPTIIANGYMRFIFAGTRDGHSPTRSSILGGITTFEGLRDKNVVTLRAFSQKNVRTYQAAYDAIMERISWAKRGVSHGSGAATSSSVAGSSESSKIDQLKTLAELRNSGALTEAEFESEKKKLLSR